VVLGRFVAIAAGEVWRRLALSVATCTGSVLVFSDQGDRVIWQLGLLEAR
jgi:hypothetical protein